MTEDDYVYLPPKQPIVGLSLADEKTAREPYPCEIDTEPTLKEADATLHRLWTWAVGKGGYDKAEWKRLEAAIWKLGRPGSEKP